ncbi:MAG: manganese efflux pump [Syntrophomonadaceae bacterium]|nr:manganese efflux pump [Syntrophomonadaceae bacterium]
MIEQFITVLLVALVLGADSFSLAMGMGLRGVSRRYELTFSSMVGIFHVMMPLIGLSLGMAAGNLFGVWAARAGAVVLAYLGGGMMIKSYKEMQPRYFKLNQGKSIIENKVDPVDGWANLTILTTSVSIDALSTGFSLGTLCTLPLYYPVLMMGSVAAVMTMAGFQSGKLFSRMIGTYAQLAGGAVLMGLAIKMAF